MAIKYPKLFEPFRIGSVELGKEMTLEDVEKLDADELVVSTGNQPKEPPIPGLNQKNVVGATDALLEKKSVDGENITVIGGGLVGCEVAVWLKEEKGKKNITLIEASAELMGGGLEPMPLPNKLMLIDLLEYHNVDVRLSTPVKRIEGGDVVVSTPQGEEIIKADTVIQAIGFNPNDMLFKEINANIPKKVWCLGDAKIPSNIMFGIRDANAIARQI